MTLYIIMSRFMKVMPHKLGTTTEAALMQNGAKDGPSGIFYLLQVVASPSLSLLSYNMVLEEDTSFLDSLFIREAP